MTRKNTLILFLGVLLGGLVTGLSFKSSVWTGFYYSDVDRIGDQATWVVSPPLYSLEECRRWVSAVLKQGDNYDYSCVKGCRFTTEYPGETIICKVDAK